LRSDPGYIFAHVQDARRSGRLDEAVAWALASPFVAIGALEVRELWRS